MECKGVESVTPYSPDEQKGAQVQRMFDSIAPAYDTMNTLMTFGLCRWWRNRAISALKGALAKKAADKVDLLDLATGTGDVAFHLATTFPKARVTGADFSPGMLARARERLATLPADLRARVSFEQADCLALPYADASFDAITVAYGVRNFERLADGLQQMWRVLRPGGVLCVVELSCPEKQPFKAGYNLYSNHLIGALGRLVSGDKRAYSYLPESIAAAPQRDALTRLMLDAGFKRASWRSLTFGVVTVYLARR